MKTLQKILPVLLVASLAMSQDAQAKKPNVLYIMADDQAPFDLKVYNSKSSLDTPVIDRLAAEGMTFNGAHQMGAWCGGVCTPSRHMIMSGRTLWHIPDKPKQSRNPLSGNPKYVPSDLADHTMAAVFNAAGYDTMRTCKKGNSYAAANKQFTVVRDAVKRGGTDETGSGWHAKQVLDYLNKRQASKDEDPFLIYFGFSHPHDTRDGKPELLAKYGAVNHKDKNALPPANPKQPKLPRGYLPGHPFNNTHMNVRDETNVSGVWTNRDERTIRNELGREYACSENIDIQIGVVLKKLEEMGELENTYIIYTSDHGMAIGRHGLQGKQNLYEHTFRVPYIVKGPGIKPGSRAVGNIYHLDALATMCDLAGIEAPKTSEGISFKPVLEGKKDTVRDVLYGAYCGGAKPGMRCVKKGDWKLIRYESTKDGVSKTQLFNLADNPDELLTEHHDPKVIALTQNTPTPKQKNLASDPAHADKLKEMEALLLAEMRSHDDPYRFSNQPDDGSAVKSTKSTPPKAPYDGSWKSLQKMPVPAWFDDGKIGIFIHWGPYSAIGYRKGGRGYAEHVPKTIYEDPKHYYPYLKKRWGAHPPEFGYKDIIPEFKAEKWNPDAWAKLFKDVGVKYVVLTAEHHDGWANWDSDLTPWNAVDKGPKRDLVGDLGKAVRKQGLKYAPSYHRERHTGFFATKKYVVRGEPRPDIAEEIKRVPEAAMLYGPEFSYNKAYVDDYVARWKEIQTKYKPDMLWVDDFPIYTRDGNQVRKGKMKPEIKYFDDKVRGMITDFMNDGAARGADVYVNNKGSNRNWPDGVGCLEKDNLKLKVIGPKWQSCTTFGTSFGYLEGDKYKSIEGVMHEMLEVISRNGNFLINIGPLADGTIAPEQVERLRAMGAWLKINGNAIYGSRYWTSDAQPNEHLVFTTNGKNLYAIKLAIPSAPFTIEATAGWTTDQVKSVKLLGSGAKVTWAMTPAGLKITPPRALGGSKYAWSFEIVTDAEQHHPNAIQTDADKALKGTKEVDLEGHDNSTSNVPLIKGSVAVTESSDSARGFSKCPLPKSSAGKVTANTKTNNDPISSLTDGKLVKSIGPVFKNGVKNGAYKMDLGKVKQVAAITSWSHRWKKIRGAQIVTLYGSNSPTDPGWDLSKFTPLGTIKTPRSKQAAYSAVSLRAAAGKSLGSYRWIVWAVSPLSKLGENTAFQELAVESH
jgi:alpha-L-fucosidase/arylsulfatase A-like enzyme